MATSKSTTEQNNVATDTLDVNKMSYSDLQKLIKDAQAVVENKRVEEIKVLADAYAKKSEAAGFSIQEAIDALEPYLPAKAARKPRAAKGSKPEKVYLDKDSTGARPEPGKTYILNGAEWTKAASGLGAAKKEFLAAIKDGAKWSQLVK